MLIADWKQPQDTFTPTWKVRGSLGEVAEDGQTRYSQQERISDGWESPIRAEHPWSLKVLDFLRSIRKSSSSSIEGWWWWWWGVQIVVCGPIMSLLSPPHPPPEWDRDRGLEQCSLRCRCSLRAFSNCVLCWCVWREAAHLEDRRAPAWSQRPGVPYQTTCDNPTNTVILSTSEHFFIPWAHFFQYSLAK